jgi:hypothetical protein
MSAGRFYNHPSGYLFSTTPSTHPADALSEWLLDLGGEGMSADPSLIPGFRLPTAPVDNSPSQFDEEEFARLQRRKMPPGGLF